MVDSGVADSQPSAGLLSERDRLSREEAMTKDTEARGELRPRVLNKRNDLATDRSVYVGRPTKWGNPFVIGRDGTRDEVIAKYRGWLEREGLDVSELRGRDLICWCSPEPCHADVLLEVANR